MTPCCQCCQMKRLVNDQPYPETCDCPEPPVVPFTEADIPKLSATDTLLFLAAVLGPAIAEVIYTWDQGPLSLYYGFCVFVCTAYMFSPQN